MVNATSAAVFLTDNPAIILGDTSTFSHAGASANTAIDGIPCVGAFTTLAQHIHSHLTLFVNGKQYAIPAAIGIYHPALIYPPATAGWYNIDPSDSTACHYDIHVHTGDGVIHMETTSASMNFYLKQFLDIWGVTFSPTGFWNFSGPTRWFETDEHVGPAGTYTVREITGLDPATIQLTRHTEFTVEVGTPVVNIPNYIFIESQL